MGQDPGVAQQTGQEPIPRNPSDVMVIKLLSALLVIVLVMFTFYVLVAEGVLDFSPPYPSEETPLTLETWGVSWEREHDIYIDDVLGLNYSGMSISLTRHWGSWSIGLSGPFYAVLIDMDTFVPPTTVEAADELNSLDHGIGWVDGQEVHVFTCYYVSDDTDPSRFNMGDSIAFVHFTFLDGVLSSYGFEDDIVYEVGLLWEEDGRGVDAGWGFVVHDGDLYSWLDHGPVDDPLS